MSVSTFELAYFVGLVIAMVIRTYYGLEYRKHTTSEERAAELTQEGPATLVFSALWGVALLLPFVTAFTSWLTSADYSLPTWLGWTGVVLYAGALWLLWRSHADLGDNWSPVPDPVAEAELVTEGVFRRIRHPMYAAHILWGLAQPLLITNWVAGPLALISAAGLAALRIGPEEEKLITAFGEQYEQYRQATGALIPKL